MNRIAVIMCVISCAAHASLPPAKSIEECKKRAASARRQCEIAYYSQCIYESENKESCKASHIDFDCSKVGQQVYQQELEAMNNENSKLRRK